jgi:hypothetical protein
VKSHLEFISTWFPPLPNEAELVNPGLGGGALAKFLAGELPAYGFTVKRINPEDWGWRIELESGSFPLWIGCSTYAERENGFLCFIEPSKPLTWSVLQRTNAEVMIEPLAQAMQTILERSGNVTGLRWWNENEVV